MAVLLTRLWKAALCAVLGFALFPTLELSADNPPESAAGSNGLRIISWNIEWFPGKRNYARGEEMRKQSQVVSEAVAEIKPDILLAQEIRDWESFARLCEVVPDLRPAVVSAFSSVKTGEYWRQQVAIGSRLPVVAAWSQRWQQHDKLLPPRGFSAAVLRLPGKNLRYILVYSLHLKSNLANTEEETQANYRYRNESIRQLLEHVHEMTDMTFKGTIVGVVVGGDFNTNQDGQFGDKVVEMMEKAGFHSSWQDVPRDKRGTWRGSDNLEATTFDFIFTKGLGSPRARIIEVPEETSDHRPVEVMISQADLNRAAPLEAEAP